MKLKILIILLVLFTGCIIEPEIEPTMIGTWSQVNGMIYLYNYYYFHSDQTFRRYYKHPFGKDVYRDGTWDINNYIITLYGYVDSTSEIKYVITELDDNNFSWKPNNSENENQVFTYERIN